VVQDSATGLTDAVLAKVGALNAQLLLDPRKWAPMAGEKVRQVIGVLSQVPAHFVILFHSKLDKNELTGTTVEEPMVYSEVRQIICGMVSQVFYATKELGTGKPVIWTTDQQYVKGIGARWPNDLQPIMAPDFKSIYGREFPNG
jgi:hypothetical protein